MRKVLSEAQQKMTIWSIGMDAMDTVEMCCACQLISLQLRVLS